MNIFISSLGRYESVGSPKEADIVVGHSFGTSTSENSVNRVLAGYILDIAEGRPVIVDRHLADSFPDGSVMPDKVVEGQISSTVGGGVGTWGTLIEADLFMTEHKLNRPLMVAQAFHIGRVAMQANRLQMNSVIPTGLPAQFDIESDQIWTRSKELWVPREIIGSLVLKIQGKL